MNPGEDETRPPEQLGDLIAQLQRLSWEIRISRDQLLKAAEQGPSGVLQRTQGMAEKLMVIQQKVLETAATLPADSEIVVPVEISENVVGMYSDGQQILRELDVLIGELHQLFSDTPVLQTH